MAVTNRDIDKLRSYLQEWKGGAVSFNVFHDDHDRLILKLEHPTGLKPPVGLALFYCEYLAGPINWKGANLEPRIWTLKDGNAGLELRDEAAGFTVRCASASLYGEPGITFPKS